MDTEYLKIENDDTRTSLSVDQYTHKILSLIVKVE